ncbi:MAG: hypothetical protein ABJA71_16180 [Ginsengibacter sp.]
MKRLLLFLIVLFPIILFSQTKSYTDSINVYIKNYVNTHEVLKGDDRKYLQFFPIDEKFRIASQFERIENSPWFMMETSGPIKKSNRVYGKINFKVNDTAVTLCV